MRNYNITRYTLILTIFSMLFFVSCDDDYPTQTSNENDIFILDILSSIDGGDIDYADHNSAEQTLIKVTLLRTNADGTSEEVQSNKNIKFNWSMNPEPEGSEQPYLRTLDGNQNIYKNYSASTNSNGEIWLYWMDEGQTGQVTLSCEYTDASGTTWYPEDENNNVYDAIFSINSLYEKVNTIEPIDYIIADIEVDNANPSNNTKQGQIGARVKDTNEIKVQDVDVSIIPSDDNLFSGVTFSSSSATTDDTGKAYFPFDIEITNELIDLIAANNDAIDLEYTVFIENTNINTINDFNNNGIPDLNNQVTLILTTEAFSIAGSLSSMTMDTNPDSFILNSDDDTEYSVQITAEALTEEGGILIPPEGQTIDFRFERSPDIGSLSQSEFESTDGTAEVTLSGTFSDFLGQTISINSYIVEEGTILQTFNKDVEIVSQEALLVEDISSFSLYADPSFIISASDDTTYTINLTASVKDSEGIGLENLNVNFQNNSSSIGNLGAGTVSTNSTGIATTTLSNVQGNDLGEIELSAYINGYVDINGNYIYANTSVTVTNSELLAYDLLENIELSLNPTLFLINDIPEDTDTSDETSDSDTGGVVDESGTESTDEIDNSANQISINAIAKDSLGAGIQGLPIIFTNSNPELGTLESNNIISNETGVAENNLLNINVSDNDELNEITITASVINPNPDNNNEIVAETSSTAIIGYQSVYNTSQVTNLDSYFLQNFSLINNINIQYEDSLVAQVLDSNNVPVQNVPINFTLSTDDIGYITTNQGWSDSNGQAGTKFIITPADMQDPNDEVTIELTISVGNYQESIQRTYVLEGSANIENDVHEFKYFPENPGSISIYTSPEQSASLQLPFIAKDDEGVRIEGVPVQFEIFWSSGRSNGSLNTSLATTCCNDDSSDSGETGEGSDDGSDDTSMGDGSLFDWDGDGNTTTNENMGIASVLYSNSLPGTADSIRAFITNPEDQSENLFEEKILISTLPVQDAVYSIFSYAVPQTINLDNVDSVYCDTIFTIASNENGQSLQNVPINFSLDVSDFNYGSITSSYELTDTNATLPFYSAQTTFCTWPNIDIDEDTVVVNINTSVADSDLESYPIEIYLIENLPECPDCQASLDLIAEYYELPAGDNDIFTSQITATVIDSTENPVPPYTLVEFQSLTQNEDGDWVQIGNIEPYKYTDENGQAIATFNMSNDVGLASIIGTAPQYNLADTIYISLYSTSASSMEIIQPFPNEIMVQGGGGVESTEIDVYVKDGNGNLVSEPFLVFFELLNSAPNGVYLNEIDDNALIECVESSNGIATVTLNSGTQPGSVPINVELYNLDMPVSCNSIDANTYDTFGITSAEAVPVTVVTGPPTFGQINYSYLDITPIGGGLYEVPLSVHLWDFYSNPVSDSTNVYIWIEGLGEAWSVDSTYELNDTIKWGSYLDLNDDGEYTIGVDDPIIIDSLLYIWNSDFASNFLANPTPGSNLAISGLPVWLPVAHPGAVDGEAKTGMLAPDNQSYPGVAWSNVYYGTSDIFANTVIKALTYDADGEKLVIDSRESHNDEALVLPFQPGTLTGTSSLQFWDFSVFGDPGLNDLDDTVAVSITGNLTDYYQYPVDDGTILLSAPGANVWTVCDPADTDGDGFVGECWEDTNGSGALEIPPTFNPDTINEDLGLTCSVCTANGGFWNYDDGNDNDGSIPDGDGVFDDDPIFGKTNGDGQVVWNISYSEALNAGDGNNPESYADFTSTILLQLLNPLQTSSDGTDILLIKSENNDNP